jgi:hypothetical protein
MFMSLILLQIAGGYDGKKIEDKNSANMKKFINSAQRRVEIVVKTI